MSFETWLVIEAYQSPSISNILPEVLRLNSINFVSMHTSVFQLCKMQESWLSEKHICIIGSRIFMNDGRK